MHTRIAAATGRSVGAIEAFVQAHQPLDADIALKFIDDYRVQPRSLDGNWQVQAYGVALKALAQQKHPRAQSVIDAVLAERPTAGERGGVERFYNERIHRLEAAVEARCLLEDFDSQMVHRKLGNRGDFFPRRELTQVERDLFTMVDAEVVNGGFSQYFGNSSGGSWTEDLVMLKRIDAPQLAGILKRATAVFGWSGPAFDRDVREQQLENLSDAAGERLGECDELWYGATESFEAKQTLYVLKNRALLEGLPDPFPFPHPDVPY